eukprot:s4523_g8.t1
MLRSKKDSLALQFASMRVVCSLPHFSILPGSAQEQASERSHGPNNPAKAWAQTAMHMASLARTFPGPGG